MPALPIFIRRLDDKSPINDSNESTSFGTDTKDRMDDGGKPSRPPSPPRRDKPATITRSTIDWRLFDVSEPHRSYWLRQALSEAPPSAAVLEQDISADVCIVGGGFTGLWTALHITEQDPSVRVVIIERDLCGSGASGRNGGFCMNWMSKASGVLPSRFTKLKIAAK